MKEKYILLVTISIVILSAMYVFVTHKATNSQITSYVEISAKKAYSKNIAIIDMRPTYRCDPTGKPKGAYHMPIDETSTPNTYIEKVREIANGRTIALICNNGKSSKATATHFRSSLDAHDIISITGGIMGSGGWIESGLPTEACQKQG